MSFRFLLAGVATLVAFVLLVSLGNWQMDRLEWKEDLIERVRDRPGLEPLTVESELLEAAHDESFFDQYEYRQALLKGRYDPSGEVRAFTSLSDAKGPLSGPGYWVLTPFVTQPKGELVYVNRGFVPEDLKGDYPAPHSDEITVRGLIRAPERGNWFTPEANMQERVFFIRDPRRISEATKLNGEVARFFLDLLPEPGAPPLPQAGETRMVFSNNHLAYAVTWYGLAAALLAVFASFVWTRLREGSQDSRLTRPGPTP